MHTGIYGHRAGDRVLQRQPAERVQPHRRARGTVQQRRQELALVDHPVEISARGGAGPHISKCVAPVEFLATRRQVDAGKRIVDRLGRTHGHAADGVHDIGEPGEPDLRVVVHPDAGDLFDGLHQQLWATEGERRVDLVLAVARDGDLGVAGNGHQRGPHVGGQGRDMDQHDRVGAAVAGIAAGCQIGLLLGGQIGAAVRADQQPGGAVARRRTSGVVGEHRCAVQRTIDPDADPDEPQQQRDHDDRDPPSPVAFAARLGRLGRLGGLGRPGRRGRSGRRRALLRRRRGLRWPRDRRAMAGGAANDLRRLGPAGRRQRAALNRWAAATLAPVVSHRNNLRPQGSHPR